MIVAALRTLNFFFLKKKGSTWIWPAHCISQLLPYLVLFLSSVFNLGSLGAVMGLFSTRLINYDCAAACGAEEHSKIETRQGPSFLHALCSLSKAVHTGSCSKG